MKLVRMLFDKLVLSEHRKYDLPTREEYIQKMRAEGWEVYTPDSNELLIDIDDDKSYSQFRERYFHFTSMLWETLNIKSKEIIIREFPSRTNGHKHIIIKLPFEMSVGEQLFLQNWLGSDPLREILSFLRWRKGDTYPSVLAMNPELFQELQKGDKYAR